MHIEYLIMYTYVNAFVVNMLPYGCPYVDHFCICILNVKICPTYAITYVPTKISYVVHMHLICVWNVYICDVIFVHM